MNNLSYGDMLNILLSNLFPYPQPTPRNQHVEQIVCSYNPNIKIITDKLFQLLKEWGADPHFLNELRNELEESLRRDRLDGCVPIYRK